MIQAEESAKPLPPAAADAIETAVRKIVKSGIRTGDIWSEGITKLGTP